MMLPYAFHWLVAQAVRVLLWAVQLLFFRGDA